MSKLKSKIWVFAAAVVLLAAASVFYFSYASVDARTGRYMALADKFISEGKYEEAILNYEKILEIDENNIPARVGLVKAYVRTGDAGNASDMLREIEILKPASGEQLAGLLDIVDELGTLLTDIESKTPGDRSYEALMSLFPEKKKIVSAYSDFLIARDNTHEAIDLLEGYATEPGNEDLAEKLALLKIPALVPDHPEGEYVFPCSITIPVPDKTKIYYTLDGSEPSGESTLYENPIELPVGETKLKLMPVQDNGRAGKVQTFRYTVNGNERSYYISGCNFDVRINKDGSADITEEITFNFSGKSNGIYRDVNFSAAEGFSSPKAYIDRKGTLDELEINNTVTADDAGLKGIFNFNTEGKLARYKIYEPSTNEEKTFVIKYKLLGVITVGDTTAEFNDELIGADWKAEIKNVLIRIHLPEGASKDELAAFCQGDTSAESRITDSSNIEFRLSSFKQGTHMASIVRFPARLLNGYSGK